MATKPGRKRKVLTLEKKLTIIEELRKGKSQRLVSEIFQVPKSTVADIWKLREKIQCHVSSSDNPSLAKKRCIIKEAQFEDLEKACYLWFMQQRARGAPVSGPLVQEKALQLFPDVYPDRDPESFKGSSGWFHKFCCRHGIRSISMQGESLSADVSSVDPFKNELSSIMEEEGYTLNQVFNADETGLLWRGMPSKTLVHCGEKYAKNFKKTKDRITLMACANSTGTCKLPLTFIHSSKKPRCFKHMDMKLLPVHYYYQKKAWMDSHIFESWFHNELVPYVKKFCKDNKIEYKILLLIDNAPAHPSTEVLQSKDKKVKSMFLPPNTTSILQPMDQGILESTKRLYKKFLLRHILLENETNSMAIPQILKNLTIKEAVYWSAQAWDEIKAETLRKGWNKLLLPIDVSTQEKAGTCSCSKNSDSSDSTKCSSNPSSSNDAGSSSDGTGSLSTDCASSSISSSSGAVSYSSAGSLPDAVVSNIGASAMDCNSGADDFLDLFQRLGYAPGDENWQTPEDWLVQDADDPGYQLMTDIEIVHEVSNTTNPEESPSEDEVEDLVSDEQACDALDISLRWLESQGNIDPVHLLLVKKWRDTAARKRFKNLKQKTLLSYCTK